MKYHANKNAFCCWVGADYAQCPRTGRKSAPTGYSWQIEGALAISWDIVKYYNILDVPYPAFLMIHTQTGCESGFVVDTVFLGNTCDLTTTSQASLNNVPNIYAYPNPTKDKIFIGGNHLGNAAILSLCNGLGQEVYHHTWENTQIETAISMASLPQGVYYLRILAGDKVFTEKIIKE